MTYNPFLKYIRPKAYQQGGLVGSSLFGNTSTSPSSSFSKKYANGASNQWNKSSSQAFGGMTDTQTFGGYNDGASMSDFNTTNTTSTNPTSLKSTSGGTSLGSIGNASGIISGLGSTIGNAVLDSNRKEDYTNAYGIVKKDWKNDVKKNQLNDFFGGMSSGGGGGGGLLSTAFGAVTGLASWAFNSQNRHEEGRQNARNYYHDTNLAKLEDQRNKHRNEMTSLGKGGMKFAIMDRIAPNKGSLVKLQQGGSIGYDKNVVPKGKLHRENNNLGDKDKGIPVVDSEGKKLFEIERDELILHLEATQVVEGFVYKYNETQDDNLLLELGKYLTEQLMTNTEHVSEKYQEA